jgi:hypothetical protein
LITNALNVNILGQLDIADNAVIVDYDSASPSPLDSIRTAIAHGYRNGLWNGTGIRSSSAMARSDMAIGYAEASDLFGTFPATFNGEPVDATSIVIRMALKGDANLDGHVNLSDFNRFAVAFGQSGRGWSRGDFNYDNLVNLADFNILASTFGQQVA